MTPKTQSKPSADQLKKVLLKRQKQAARKLAEKHTQAWRYLTETQVALPGLHKGAARLAAAGALAGSLMMGQPRIEIASPTQKDSAQPVIPAPKPPRDISPQALSRLLSARLMEVLPAQLRPLTEKEERQIEQILQSILGIKASAELDGKRLDRVFGTIGAEQHLLRFPEDKAELHQIWTKSGIAPKTSAWGYFAPSQEALSPELEQKEKYYIAVQTFLSPQWRESYSHLKDWFKYRKMMVINPKLGKVVIADVADAGPATWTGKQFGGSPEVMEALGLHQGPRKGEVLVLFLDDPNDQIKLGPL